MAGRGSPAQFVDEVSRVPRAGEGNCDLFGEMLGWFAISLPDDSRKDSLEVRLREKELGLHRKETSGAHPVKQHLGTGVKPTGDSPASKLLHNQALHHSLIWVLNKKRPTSLSSEQSFLRRGLRKVKLGRELKHRTSLLC